MPPFRRVIGLSLMADGYFIHWPLISPREAMTTAEPPAVVALSAFRIYCSQQNLSAIVGPGGEAFCLFCVICGFQFSCPFVPFVVPTLPYSTDANQSS